MKRLGMGPSIAVVALIALAMSMVVTATASAQMDVQHGITFTKGCTSPVNIGAPYACSFTVRNIVDDAQDTLTMNSLIDVVHSAGGDVSSGELFSTLKLDNGGTSATCSAASGIGTAANPWTGATSCTLPFGSRINVQSTSHYTVQPNDFNLPNHVLTDSASLGWHDLCNDPAHTGDTNCNPNPPPNGAGSSAVINPNAPPLCATSITSNFNGTRIAAGTTIWFNSVFKVSGLHAPATIQLTNSHIAFSAGGVNYTITVPNAIVSFSSVSNATISFDGTNWQTAVPTGFGDNIFLSGVAFSVPATGLPGGINPVTWTGQFLSSASGVTVNWQWSAAVYSTFNTDYNALGVKPLHSTSLDAYPNGDQAGTPENMKSFVIGGARGGGGANFTGSYSPTGHCP